MPQQTQITRHDCVEGWSAIGKWSGVPLRALLDAVGLRHDARYVVFRCMDNDGRATSTTRVSTSIKPAIRRRCSPLRLNEAPLDPDHGAPVRLRVPTQLGYKSAKWIARIEVVGTFATIAAETAAIGKTKATNGTRAIQSASASGCAQSCWRLPLRARLSR